MTVTSQALSSSADVDAFVTLAQRECRAGRLAEAAEAYRKILAIRPDLAETYVDLGNLLVSQGKPDEAVAQFERAATLRPDFAEAHMSLGFVFQSQGKPDEAAARYERALALKPDLFQAHSSLGNILWQRGNLDHALARHQQAVALQPDFAEGHNDLGNVLTTQGKLDEALIQYERAVALMPGLFQAHHNLGLIHWRQGRLDQAVARYAQAIALRPENADAHYNLGNVLRDQGKLDEAAARYQRALSLRPDLTGAHHNLGVILWQQGKAGEADASFRRALALNPRSASTYFNLANALKEQGKLDEAAAEYNRALALQPDLAEAHYNRADLKTFCPGDPDLAVLEALAADSDRLPPSKRSYIHFALGKALEDVGDCRRAFEHFLQGNTLKRREVNYDVAANRQLLRRITEVFDSSLLERFGGMGDASQAPIFVLGMPRSGSTLIEQILASQPKVHAAGELASLDLVVQSVSGSAGLPFPEWIEQLGADDLRRLGEAYIARLPTLPDGRTRIIDKAPGNFFYIGLIHLILPNARIIHSMRDPVDTCFSCFSKNFTSAATFSYDLAELGRCYHDYYELMAHWRKVLPAGAMLDVSYEAVVDNLEEQARRLIDFCGLSWDDHCLSFHETNRLIRTASNVQVRRPLYRTSVARWRRYEAYLLPLLAELDPCRQ